MLLLLVHKFGEVWYDDGRNPLFIGNAFATRWTGTLKSTKESRNPLFIGNAFATTLTSLVQLTFDPVAIPYSSGMLLLLGLRAGAGGGARRRNPLFIGNAFATMGGQSVSVNIRWSSQSPIHRECFCYTSGSKRLKSSPFGVAIPYSSGMLLLPSRIAQVGGRSCLTCRNPLFIGNAFATFPWGRHRRDTFFSRNPLFIGNAFATVITENDIYFVHESVAIPYSSGMLLLRRSGTRGMRGEVLCRNPLFIGNAFATRFS